jgi:hypothetical protein
MAIASPRFRLSSPCVGSIPAAFHASQRFRFTSFTRRHDPPFRERRRPRGPGGPRTAVLRSANLTQSGIEAGASGAQQRCALPEAPRVKQVYVLRPELLPHPRARNVCRSAGLCQDRQDAALSEAISWETYPCLSQDERPIRVC